IQPAAPVFNTLLQLDPFQYPRIIPDLAERWESSPDGTTFTFYLRRGVKFHNGKELTSEDIKDTFDKVINPPSGFLSPRLTVYKPVIKEIATPDPYTIVFRLNYPSGSFLLNIASPWNTIPPKEQPPADTRLKPIGTGPFIFERFIPGQLVEVKKNPNYFIPGRPYLDSIRYLVIVDLAARAAAIRTGRAHIEFRDMPPTVKDDIVRSLGDRVVVQETDWSCLWDTAAQTQRAPFSDKRVRLALNYAIDHRLGAQVLYPITGLRPPGTMIRFGSEWSPTWEELEKFPSWEPDAAARKERARQLLREAGVPEGFTFELKNRDIPNPYHDYANFLIDQWRQVGLVARHRILETTPHRTDARTGNFDLIIIFNCDAYDDPDRFYGARMPGSPDNYSFWTAEAFPDVVELFDRQSRTLDYTERVKLVKALEQKFWEHALYIKGYWGTRRVVHWKTVRNYIAPPNHYSNQRLQDVWLAAD
ncbi:MAG: ABC transporter substrate-binding protein, partial [Chloroflexota bacterium]|nr:ABC transporter substrate-binding protein [Chloroflexota bacterium]